MNKVKLSYFKYSLILASLLSITTLIVSIFSPVFDRRLIFMFFYTVSLNFALLLGLAFLGNWKKTFIGHINKEKLFVGITFIYSFFYVVSNLIFLFTSQSAQLQTLFFSYKVRTETTVAIYAFFFFLFLFLLTFFFSKKFNFVYIGKDKRLFAKRIFLISIVVFLVCAFIISSYLGIFNPIVSLYNEGNVIYVKSDSIGGNFIFEETSKLSNPNVVFILMDAVTFDRFGSYGYPRNVSPNIDSLASKGFIFENAYATATHSDYSQPGYLSSRYMLVNNYRNFFEVNHNRVFIWDVFKKSNYSTAYISSQDDLWAGMDKYFNFSSLDYYTHSLTDGETDYGMGLEKKDYDHKTLDKSIDWLEKQANETENPFFLYLNFQATHQPLAFPEEYNFEWEDDIDDGKTVDRADNALKYVDLQIGKLLNYLDENDLRENTVFVISSDHGHDWYARHHITGHGKSIYNEELQVPLIFYFPDLNSRIIEKRVSHIDVLPTLFYLLNISYNEQDFIGKPMRENGRFFFYVQSHKYLIGMIKGDLKLIIDLNRNLVEVYDLKNDSSEEYNLVDSKNYDLEILELLMWHNCQLNYFSVKKPPEELKFYCDSFT